ncbi:MAG: ABC transporter ATP-binding protein [Desulfovibrio sp.]|nr:ABC transporter ATP-binding protein [Desulfovibrio sp.]
MIPGAAAPEALAELTGITRRYKQAERETEVLRGIALSLRRGDFLALEGTSGSGKSTLLHILGLLDQPDSGTYRLNGHDVGRLTDDEASFFRNRFIGFVFQSFYLMPRSTALANVLLPGMYTGESLPPMRRRAFELLERVGLAERAEHTPSQLSGGQQQRVSIARALFNSPDLLLADEPTGQLDSATSREIMELFQEINLAGTTVVLVTHDPRIALYADRHIRISDGLLEEEKP